MKRMIVFCWLLCCCAACCIFYDEPASTEAGWKVFGYANESFAENAWLGLRAIQFDEYRRQTTDEGRTEIQDRYFPRERIINKEDEGLVVSPSEVWRFRPVNGQSLSEPGAEWEVVRAINGAIPEKARIVTGTNAEYMLRSKTGPAQFETQCELTFRIAGRWTRTIALEIFFAGGTLRSIYGPQLDIAYTIVDPAVFDGNFSEGKVDIIVRNEIDSTDEYITATYLWDGCIRINYGGSDQVWFPGGTEPEWKYGK